MPVDVFFNPAESLLNQLMELNLDFARKHVGDRAGHQHVTRVRPVDAEHTAGEFDIHFALGDFALHSRDHGAHWRTVAVGTGDDLTAVAASADRRVTAVGYWGTILAFR
jgi:hypothetical protein